MKKWKLASIALSVSMIGSVQVAYAANPVSQQQVNNLFCNSNLPIPSNLCPTSSPATRNPASQQYVCERYLALAPVKIGDVVGNGIVYYIDNASRKGLIAAMSDAPGGSVYAWDTTMMPSDISGASEVALFTGKSNTNAIVAVLAPTVGQAAAAARAYPAPPCPSTITCDPTYSLPSINELSLLFPFSNSANTGYTNIGLGGFLVTPSLYWSSSDILDNVNAWRWDSSLGRTANGNKRTGVLRVRPVRSFYY